MHGDQRHLVCDQDQDTASVIWVDIGSPKKSTSKHLFAIYCCQCKVQSAFKPTDGSLLILTVEVGQAEESPVQDPFPEDRQRKENVCDWPKDSDPQGPTGEETMSYMTASIVAVQLEKSTRFLFFFNPVHQDKNKKVKVKKETHSAAAIYKFDVKRKRWGGCSRHAEKKSPTLPIWYWWNSGLLDHTIWEHFYFLKTCCSNAVL